jgi:hydrogenase maturation protease
METPITSRTLVLGLGNTLLGDEGAGVHVLHALQDLDGPEDVEFLDGGTLSFTLAGPIEDHDELIVIDAAQLHAEPGTVRVFENEAMDNYLGSHTKRSVHEVSLIDLMNIARLIDHLPRRRALIGIQPQQIDWSHQPSPAVAAAIPRACKLAMNIIRRWHA